MANITFISNFLTKVEGPRQTVGYIPCYLKTGGSANYKGGSNPGNYKAMGASGVTIATGCDLGQTDIATLKGYGLTDAFLLNILSPYIGLKKDAAIQKLHQAPLAISAGHAELLDHAVHGGYLNRYVRPAYEKKSRVKFDDLPNQAQAVVMSVCFQKGCGGVARDWPKLWSYLTQGDWASAAHELRYGFKQYLGRRRTEAALLEELCGGVK